MSKGKLQAVLLGVAQDAGVPQAGCTCQNCSEARGDYSKRQFVVCMGLVDRAVGKSWLLDYTPDFREQLYRLKEFAPKTPVFRSIDNSCAYRPLYRVVAFREKSCYWFDPGGN